MSRAGNPRDNAVMESFWGRFKDTLRKHFRYWERDDLRSTIEQAIYYFNNSHIEQNWWLKKFCVY